MIDVKQNEDGSFTIEWDSEDPYESIFNDWTAKDFEELIEQYCQEVIAKEKYIRNKDGLNFNAKQVQQSNYEGYSQTEEEFYGSQDSANSRKEFAETGNVSEATREDWNSFWEGDNISEQESDNIEELTEHFFQDNYIEATNEETFWELPPLQEGGFPDKDDRLWEG